MTCLTTAPKACKASALTKPGYRGPCVLHIDDDVPGFRHGWRRFQVQVGTKYVRLCNGRGHDRRITRGLFDRLRDETEALFDLNDI